MNYQPGDLVVTGGPDWSVCKVLSINGEKLRIWDPGYDIVGDIYVSHAALATERHLSSRININGTTKTWAEWIEQGPRH